MWNTNKLKLFENLLQTYQQCQYTVTVSKEDAMFSCFLMHIEKKHWDNTIYCGYDDITFVSFIIPLQTKFWEVYRNHPNCLFICSSVYLSVSLPRVSITFAITFEPKEIGFYTPRNEVIIPPATKLGGVYWNHPVRLSVCLSVRQSVCRRAVR